jgi:hypothetical protein
MEMLVDKGINLNNPNDTDNLKHTLPENITDYAPTHILYIYGDTAKSVRSLIRREIGSIQSYKLRGLYDECRTLPKIRYLEELHVYVNRVLKNKNREPLGIINHIALWKDVPGVFFVHHEDICKSDKIDDFLGLPVGTCSKFEVVERTTSLKKCETPEYLRTMSRFDKKISDLLEKI